MGELLDWAVERNGFCEYIVWPCFRVPKPPHYFHRHRCINPAKFRFIEGYSVTHNRHVCGRHKTVLVRRNKDANVTPLMPAEPKKKRGRPRTFGRCTSREDLVAQVWFYYDRGQNGATLARHMRVSEGVIHMILNSRRPK